MNFNQSIHNQTIVLAVFSLCVNLIFFSFYNPKKYLQVSSSHGNVGYNIYTHNQVGISFALKTHMNALQKERGQLVDYAEVSEHNFGPPTEPFTIHDTVGYGIILGLLWKITNSLLYVDVQILQIIIFTLLTFFVYQIGLLLFSNARIAVFSTLSLSCFIPLIAMNVQPARDIWAYYGVVILVYGLLSFLKNKTSIVTVIFAGIFFALCQFVRPAAFMALITACLFLVCCALVQKNRRALYVCFIFLSTNMLFFWLPFMTYNKISYDRYFVGPVGQDLIEGLGEFPNKWGYKLNDVWYGNYIREKYNLIDGTPEFDDAAKNEFYESYSQDPWFYWLAIIRRFPMVIFPSLYAIFIDNSPFSPIASYWQNSLIAFSSVYLFFDFFIRHLYVRIFILIGYCGLFLMLKKRYFFQIFLLLAMLFAGLGKLPSHIEYRYLIPFYWAFSFAVGFAFDQLIKKIKMIMG